MVGRWKEKMVILLLIPTRDPTAADRPVAQELQLESVVERRPWLQMDYPRTLPRQRGRKV
jgi:hypothetical protein